MTRQFKNYNKKGREFAAKKLPVWKKMTCEYTIEEHGFRFFSQEKTQWARRGGKYTVITWHVEFVTSIRGKNVSCSIQDIPNPEFFFMNNGFSLTDKIQGKTYFQWVATINGMTEEQGYDQAKKTLKIQSCKQAFIDLQS